MARCLLVTVVGLAALSSAGVASAAYDPSLLVGDTSPALGASGPVRIFLRTRQSDEATAVVTIYAPRGYGVKLGHAPGVQLGRFVAEVRTRAVGGALQTVEGTIRSADPAGHVENPCAPGVHEAVWMLEFRLAGGTHQTAGLRRSRDDGPCLGADGDLSCAGRPVLAGGLDAVRGSDGPRRLHEPRRPRHVRLERRVRPVQAGNGRPGSGRRRPRARPTSACRARSQ